MKKNSFSVSKLFGVIPVASLFLVFLSSCKKDTIDNNNVPVSALMAFNLSPDKPAIGIALSGNLLTATPLGYTSYTGGYRNIYPGDRSVQSYDYTKDSTLVNAAFQFENQRYYSLFVVGNAGAYKNVIVKDEIDSLPATHAYIRYINAIPDSNPLTVLLTSNGNTISNEVTPFASVSGFTPVGGGDVNVSISNGSSITTDRTIGVENGKIYTVLVTGVPNAVDSTKSVKIKYIINGTISPDDKK